MRRTLVLAAAMWLAALVQPALALELGELPPGAVSHSQMHGASEVLTYVIFDPAPFRARLPAGTDFVTLKQVAARSPDVAAYLQDHPERETWAWSVFEIIGVKSMAYDGLAARLGPNGGMAVWYPAIRRLDHADARAKGYNELALGAWVSDRRLAAHMRARGYPIDYGRIRFGYDGKGLSAALQAPGLKVGVSCRFSGPRFTPDWGRSPYTYQTLWTPPDRADTFEVVVWGGHQDRACSGASWRAAGSHPFAVAFRDRPLGGEYVSNTEAAFDYELKGGLYRR